MRRVAVLMFMLAAALPLAAQNTTNVTATVVDPNGLPYSFATFQAQLIPTGVTPTIQPPCNGQNVTPCVVAAFTSGTLDVNGTFNAALASNAAILPGGTQWQFTIAEKGVQPPFGFGPQQFVTRITVSGASLNLSATFSALAPALTHSFGGGGGGAPAGSSGDVQINNGSGGFGAGGENDNGTALNISRDLHLKGPNPYTDITLFGGYVGSFTPPSISCNTVATNPTIVCSGGVSDFLIGHGVSIPGAGAAPTTVAPGAGITPATFTISGNVATVQLATSTSYLNGSSITATGMTDATLNGTYTNVQMTGYGMFTASFTHANCSPCNFGSGIFSPPFFSVVSPIGQTGGTTTWHYKVSARDNVTLGISAASPDAFTTVGWATLGKQTYTIATNGCVTSGGLTTITTTTPHSIPNQTGLDFFILGGTTGTPTLEGKFKTVSTTASTVTMNTQGMAPATYCPSGGTLQVIAENEFQWYAQPGRASGWLIWRAQDAGPYSLVAITAGSDPAFFDLGQVAPVLDPADAAYIPATPPVAPVNGILSAEIAGISGNNITLNAAPQASITGATVLHDNTANIIAACDFFGTGGADLYSPSPGSLVIDSLLDLNNCSSQWVRITFASQVRLNEPIVPKNFTYFNGDPKGSAGASSPFATGFQTNVNVQGYPGFLIPTGSGGTGITFTNLNVGTGGSYENDLYMDTDALGNAVINVTLNNTSLTGNFISQAWKIGGGFGVYVSGGGSIQTTGATTWGYEQPVLNRVNCGLGQNNPQLSGIWNWQNTTLDGGGIAFDTCGRTALGANVGALRFEKILNEGDLYPLMDFSDIATGNIPGGITVISPSYADAGSGGGQGTPMFEMGNANVRGFTVEGDSFNNCGNGNQPLFSGAATQTARISSIGCGIIGLSKYVSFAGDGIGATGTTIGASGTSGQVFFAMQTPAAPTVALSGVTGPAAGTYFYKILAVDIDGNFTAASPISAPITVNGSQGVQISWTPVPGQAFTTICRGTSPGGVLCTTTGGGFQVSGTSYVDGPIIFPNQSLPTSGVAGSSGLGPNGLFGYQLVLPQSGFKTTIKSDPLTGNQNINAPNLSGDVGVTATLTSCNPLFDVGGLITSTPSVFLVECYTGATPQDIANACITAAIAVNGGCDFGAWTVGHPQTFTGPILANLTTNQRLTIILPASCDWKVNITNGTDSLFEIGGGSVKFDESRTAQYACQIQNISPANGLFAFVTVNGATTNYTAVRGLFINNSVATASTFDIEWNGSVDNSYIQNNQITDTVGSAQGEIFVGGGTNTVCCGMFIDHNVLYGSDTSNVLLQITAASNLYSIFVTNNSIGHPGSGKFNFQCTDGSGHVSAVYFWANYEELSRNGPGTVATNSNAGCGLIDVRGNISGAFVASTTSPLWTSTGNNIQIHSAFMHRVTNSYTLPATVLSNSNALACTSTPCLIKTDSVGVFGELSIGNNYFAGMGVGNTTYSSAHTATIFETNIDVTGTTTISIDPTLLYSIWNVTNAGGATVTVAPLSGTINGAASLTLAANAMVTNIHCNGTNCWAKQ